jgi:hypothetical protein
MICSENGLDALGARAAELPFACGDWLRGPASWAAVAMIVPVGSARMISGLPALAHDAMGGGESDRMKRSTRHGAISGASEERRGVA